MSMTTKVADDTPRWVRIFNWCCLAIAVVALVLLVRGVGLGRMRDLMVDTGVWFAYVVASGLGVLVLETLALRRLLGKETRGVGFGRTMATMLAGQAINAVTPTGKLGEATKVMLLGRWLSRGAVLAAVVKSNVINFFISVTVVAIGVPLIAMLFHLPPASATCCGRSGLASRRSPSCWPGCCSAACSRASSASRGD